MILFQILFLLYFNLRKVLYNKIFIYYYNSKMVSCENSLKRSKSYIFGFDELVEGGFPDGSSILVNGSPGAGKTIFSLQYLVNGAINDNEKGIYFTFEEKKKHYFYKLNSLVGI